MLFSGLTDIHSHILHGVDDGPDTLEQSLEMAKQYTETGISSVIATPHHIPGTGWNASKDIINQKVQDLNKNISTHQLPLEVFPGMEIALHNRIEKSFANDTLLPLGNSNYYLMEPPFSSRFSDVEHLLKNLLENEKKLILAHPERAYFCQKEPGLMIQFIEMGLKVQLNIGSLLGYFGKKCCIIGTELIKLGCVHFIASDSHSILKRTPPTKQEIIDLASLIGKENFKALHITNPEKLLQTNSLNK